MVLSRNLLAASGCGYGEPSEMVRKALAFAIGAAICCVPLAPCVAGAPPQTGTTHSNKTQKKPDGSAWQYDLRKMGYSPVLNDPMPTGLGIATSVMFINRDVIAASFLVREAIPGLQRRDDPAHVPPFKLRAILLEARNGHVLKTLDWPEETTDAGIFSRFDGTFVVFDPSRVTRYSVNGSKLGEVALPAGPRTGFNMWGLSVSPGGKLLVAQFKYEGVSECEWISTDTMTEEAKDCSLPHEFSVSDAGVTARAGDDGGREQILLAERGGPWRNICDGTSFRECRHATFVSEGAVLLYDPGEFSLVDSGGKTIFRHPLNTSVDWLLPPPYFTQNSVRASASGDRFGVLFLGPPSTLKPHHGGVPGATTIEPEPSRLSIFDAHRGRKIFEILNERDEMNCAASFGISPEGDFLVVQSDGVVKFYKLPPAKPESERQEQTAADGSQPR